MAPPPANIARSFDVALQNFQAKRFADAEAACIDVLRSDEHHVDALHLLGVLRSKAGNLDESVSYLERALELRPDLTEARFNLGKGLRDLGRREEAFAAFHKVSEAWPERADIWTELAVSHSRLNRRREAIEAYRRAIYLGGENAHLLTQLARLLFLSGDLVSPEELLTKAIALDPSYTPACINLAILREDQGKIDEALSIYRSLNTRIPNDPEVLKRYALALLSSGNLKQGWSIHAQWQSGQKNETSVGKPPQPYWSGEDLSDKSLLVWTDQGPGDEILLCSMLPDLESLAKQVTLACSPRMASIFERSFPWCRVMGRDGGWIPEEQISDIDFQATLTELGAILRPDLSHFQKHTTFLTCDRNITARLRDTYKSDGSKKLLVGISWKSNNAVLGEEKSTRLDMWDSILTSTNCRFVSLQYGDCAREIADISRSLGITVVHDKSIDPLTNMDDFAAQVAAMDLVISTTNTTVHFAGALGISTWNIVPKGSGRPWYWFQDGNNCPWYSTMRLYRQEIARDWKAPLSCVGSDLRMWTHTEAADTNV